MFDLNFSDEAEETLNFLQQNESKKYKKVLKTLGLLSINPRHPSLNTHKYYGLSGANNEEIFEAYVENKTPSAYRVFWFYGPQEKYITILAITPHPSSFLR
ncbi:hypothetical protein [Geminocystis sp. GBBB08]|uniref:hypothetical protein n=1 Tax=Geminocystis sp. GBBB08 TaxID=2604140 RepID=UPI0027E26A25|nr:hypothetical protein [Geminocystis sp. GBBB08]